MKIYRALSQVPAHFGPSVVTIGNFDGVHCGHRQVLAQVIARAAALQATPVAVTFDPHPGRVLAPERTRPLITPLEEKLRLLQTTGISATLVLPFTPEFAGLSALEFAQQVLCHTLATREIHEGENFRLGCNAEADMAQLASIGAALGFTVHAYPPRTARGDAISSSRIRTLIQGGQMHQARALLGRPFAIASTPARGRGYGTRYAVPTINLAPYEELLPAHGVYVTTLTIGTGQAAKTFRAVTNVGNRPTFGADSFSVESHLLDFHPVDLSESTPLRLTFLKRLRGEIRWPSPEALKQQIGRDVDQAQRYFSLCQRLAPQVLAPAAEQASLQVSS
ncbi:MAG: riboflavin biosynthesis protein RibF [Acidobacteriota bacterium]|nr:riboflavin biosynthesis protein RibF [Acidobacteriota bacterium]